MAARGSGDHHCATGARSSLPAASVPTKGPVSSVLGAAPRGATEPSPCLGTVLPPRWAFSHRALLVFQPAPGEVHHSPPPAALPGSTTSFPTSRFPPGWTCHQSGVTNLVSPQGSSAWRGWLFRAWECFEGNTYLSRMLLSTRYVFSCLPPHPSCLSCQAVLPTWWEHPQPWAVISKENPGEHCDTRETFAFSSPPARSQSPQPRFGSGWLSLPICPSRCALPPGSCLVHSPAVAPATSQTLT